MTDRASKIAELKALFPAAKKPRAPRQKPAAAGNTIIVNGDGVAAHQIAGGDIHNHVNEKKVVKNEVVRGPGYISSAGARKIQGRITTLVNMDVAANEAGGDKAKLYARWHTKLKNQFGVPSYLEIPAAQEQQAIDWLQTQKVMRRPKIRRADNDMWRNDLYSGIWARTTQIKKSKADVYQLVFERYGKKVISLKSLGERDLKDLNAYILRTWKVS